MPPCSLLRHYRRRAASSIFFAFDAAVIDVIRRLLQAEGDTGNNGMWYAISVTNTPIRHTPCRLRFAFMPILRCCCRYTPMLFYAAMP